MKDFTPFQEALELKQLGFDENCFTWYWDDIGLYKGLQYGNHNKGITISAPTYAQAFRFFREKYKLHSHINSDNSWNIAPKWWISGGIWDLNGNKDSRYDWDSDAYNSYPEAELACLKKLIEIVKQKQP